MEKINIAEILKDCPKGMELDCTMYENVEFDYIEQSPESRYPIHCLMKTNDGYNTIIFADNGCYDRHPNAKCVIYPKGKTTWEGFQRPFKNGDIITCTNSICTFVAIYKCMCDKNSFYRYARLTLNYRRFSNGEMHFSPDDTCSDFANPRFATEEEKQKLFDAIKENGYKWNPETKTLEKLIEPKFKVGDRVLWNYDTKIPRTISKVELTSKGSYVYWIECKGCSSGWWNETELTPIPNKFDISTLKPFDKVLVRDSDEDLWSITMYSHYAADKCYPFVTIFVSYPQCIPYEGNQHLLGTTDDCDEYYKTWE